MNTLESFMKEKKLIISQRIPYILDQYLPTFVEGNHVPGSQHREALRYLALSDKANLVRPLLTYIAYYSVQSREEPSYLVDVAIAAEFLHLATLIIDDIQDGGKIRRDQPAVHLKYDEKIATLAAFVSTALIYDILGNAGGHSEELRTLTSRSIYGLSLGQELDLKKEIHNDTSLLHAHRLKTSAIVLAGKMGGIVGGADATAMYHLEKSLEALTIAYQIEDDRKDRKDYGEPTFKSKGLDAEKYTAVDAWGVKGAGTKMREFIGISESYAKLLPNNELPVQFLGHVFGEN